MTSSSSEISLVFGSDHGGFDAKKQLMVQARDAGFQVLDVGNELLDPDDDYPKFAAAVGRAVGSQESANMIGVLLCRSGVGVAIAANKCRGVRAATVTNAWQAEHARSHDHANVICLGADDIKDVPTMWSLLQKFVETSWSGEPRHERRVAMIQALENSL
jgi:RpiB/LacA/LacB family sugar-phosphate isomerase